MQFKFWIQELSVDGREFILHTGQLGGYNSDAFIARKRISSLLELDVKYIDSHFG